MMSNNPIHGSSPLSKINQDVKPPEFRSLQDLIDKVSGKHVHPMDHDEDSGLAQPIHYPFLAIVGQYEMKLALTLALINPQIGGVLLLGPRGTGKSTAIQGLTDLLPENKVSRCFYGCLEEDIEAGGLDAVCPECAEKFANGISLSTKEKVHLVELPLNAKLNNVIGGLDKRQLSHSRMRLKRGILSLADQNILFIDEINLLSNEIINAILDAAAMGKFTIRRGTVSATYKSRFILVGSMNPDEGTLKPQILDRFGLRILTRGLQDDNDRYQAYLQSIQFRKNPVVFQQQYKEETEFAKKELEEARREITKVILPIEIAKIGIKIIQELKIESLRTEIALFEAAKAHAAANKNNTVTLNDLITVAPLALRLRSSKADSGFFDLQENSDKIINDLITRTISE